MADTVGSVTVKVRASDDVLLLTDRIQIGSTLGTHRFTAGYAWIDPGDPALIQGSGWYSAKSWIYLDAM